MTYHPRIVDRELAERLQATGAVVIEGPRACGKTTTARQIAASEARSTSTRLHAAWPVSSPPAF